MNNTSLKQKISLIIFGLVLSVFVLEITLRIAGGIVLFLQERHNHLSFSPNEFRILCLGESTTALGGEDSYPSQLQEMLNAQGTPQKFTVINKGIISTTTNYILGHIDQNLDHDKPQLVIVMMGINDKAYMRNPYKSLWWENFKAVIKDFRVYKLFHLLYEHITHRIKEINASSASADLPANTGDYHQVENFLKLVIAQSVKRFNEHMSIAGNFQTKGQLSQAQYEEQFAKQSALSASLACVQLAERYRLEGLYKQAGEVLQEAGILNLELPQVYQELGELDLAQGKNIDALNAFQKAFKLDGNNSAVLQGLARGYHQERKETEAFLIYTGYLQIKPQDYWGYVELARWLREDGHNEAALVYLKRAIEIYPYYDQAYVDIGQIYQQQGKEDLAKEYFQKAAQKESSDFYPATLVNYSLLVNKILKRHIPVMVMQYPLRDISPLKHFIGPKNGVIYVENKDNFRKALSTGGFDRYFKDHFAYNFGHCTRAGNELIAQQLRDIILSKVIHF